MTWAELVNSAAKFLFGFGVVAFVVLITVVMYTAAKAELDHHRWRQDEDD